MAVDPIPEGYRTVTPYLPVPGVAGVIEFLKKAFDAEEQLRMPGPNDTVMHAEMKIGDSVVMMGEPPNLADAMPAMLYVYVADVDESYRRAVDAGGTSMQEPKNEFYGDRVAAVKDPAGNVWYLSTHVEDVPDDELQRRMQEARPQS